MAVDPGHQAGAGYQVGPVHGGQVVAGIPVNRIEPAGRIIPTVVIINHLPEPFFSRIIHDGHNLTVHSPWV